jgi:hypothetical protein
MELLQIALKLLSITFFINLLGSLVNLISTFFSISSFGISPILANVFYVALYFIIFYTLFIQPKWFTNAIGQNQNALNLDNINFSPILDIGIILISISYICNGLIRITSFIMQYAIKFNVYNPEFSKDGNALNDILKQIEPIIGIIVGILLLVFRKKMVDSFAKKKD